MDGCLLEVRSDLSILRDVAAWKHGNCKHCGENGYRYEWNRRDFVDEKKVYRLNVRKHVAYCTGHLSFIRRT